VAKRAPKNSLRRWWQVADSDRQEVLDRARLCASLTKPWVLPPEGHTASEKLPEAYSSLAARGITNLEGRLLLALYPPGMPFFRLRPAGKFRFDGNVDPQMLNEFEARLYLQELAIQAKLEQADKTQRSNTRRAGFRSRKRTSLSQLLITGDTLEMLQDDYSIKVFRRDQYATNRDSGGDVRYHVIKEQIDPLAMLPDQFELSGFDRGVLSEKPAHERKADLYTLVEWNPQSRRWVITQEVNDNIIHESEEPITPFMCTPFELAPGEHYGRGIIETNLGDVKSMNSLTERILDFAAMASKQLWTLDYNSQVRPNDLTKPTGSVIQARVAGGQVQDIGLLKAEKMNDFQVVSITREAIRKDLAVTMLMEGEATPTGERVTAYQVQRVAMELEGALGGVYAPIADHQQIPLIERMLYQMRRDALLPPLPDDSIEVEAVTGINALSRESDSGKLMQVLQIVAQLGPEVMQRFDKGVLLDLLMRQIGVYQAGLVKSEEQMQQEMQAMQQAAMQQQASQQMIQSAGAIAEKSVPQAAAPMGAPQNA
jgi:hypothetical protein